MSEAMAVIGVSNLEDLVDFVVENAEEGESTFCIEYELYAQYLFNFRPKSFFLDKWSNLGIPRYKIRDLTYDEIFKRYSDYASISAHSYINWGRKVWVKINNKNTQFICVMFNSNFLGYYPLHTQKASIFLQLLLWV